MFTNVYNRNYPLTTRIFLPGSFTFVSSAGSTGGGKKYYYLKFYSYEKFEKQRATDRAIGQRS
jgi:hypothetical protein